MTLEVAQGVVQEIAQEVEQHQQDCFVGWGMSQVSSETTRGVIADIQFQNFLDENDAFSTSFEP